MMLTAASSHLLGCTVEPTLQKRPDPSLRWQVADARTRQGYIHQLLRRLRQIQFGASQVRCAVRQDAKAPRNKKCASVFLPELPKRCKNSGGKLIAGVYAVLTWWPAIQHLMSLPMAARPREFELALDVTFWKPFGKGQEAEFYLDRVPEGFCATKALEYKTGARIRPQGGTDDEWFDGAQAHVSFLPCASRPGLRVKDFGCLCSRSFGFGFDVADLRCDENRVTLELPSVASVTEAMFILFVGLDIAAIHSVYAFPGLKVGHRIVTRRIQATFHGRPTRCTKLSFLIDPDPLFHTDRVQVGVRCFSGDTELCHAWLDLVNVNDKKGGGFQPTEFRYHPGFQLED